MNTFVITGQLIDLHQRTIYPAEIHVENGIVADIKKTENADDQYILPGFVDAHIHVESSMLTPSNFAKLAVKHGTVGTVSDPHEIANVCGIEGVRYMIEDSKKTPFKIFFGAPSCVPATSFETAGACLNSNDIRQLLQDDDIWYLTEMMNYPGVLFKDPEVLAKIEAAKSIGKPVDGHAPGLRGEQAMQYASAGITTDHECFTLEEALDKIGAGMKILIREGSAAKNYEALSSLLETHPDKVMFCSDDKHPDELMESHINALVKRSLAKGYDLFNVLRAASANAIQHYGLPVGQLRINDPADFIVADNLSELNILQTYIGGEIVMAGGDSKIKNVPIVPINNFNALPRQNGDFKLKASGSGIRVIEAIEGQLVTNEIHCEAYIKNGYYESDVDNDFLKMAVINRYAANEPASICFIKNFGLKHGAIASTVAHDCHNIIAIGVDDESLTKAVNAVIAHKGGIAATDGNDIKVLGLPIAGLMSDQEGSIVASKYVEINQFVGKMGSKLQAPFMTLSFMALLVIPSLKLSDKGLFDGNKFEFVTVGLV